MSVNLAAARRNYWRLWHDHNYLLLLRVCRRSQRWCPWPGRAPRLWWELGRTVLCCRQKAKRVSAHRCSAVGLPAAHGVCGVGMQIRGIFCYRASLSVLDICLSCKKERKGNFENNSLCQMQGWHAYPNRAISIQILPKSRFSLFEPPHFPCTLRVWPHMLPSAWRYSCLPGLSHCSVLRTVCINMEILHVLTCKYY